MAARQWTDEQRARQSAMIWQWQPWKHSTGPHTPEGKAVSSQNVLVGKCKRQLELDQAVQELKAAQEKVRVCLNRMPSGQGDGTVPDNQTASI